MHLLLRKYQWLIFDADNTLFDYNKAEKNALLQTLNEFDIPYDSKEIIQSYHTINHAIWSQFERGILKSQQEIKLKRTEELFELLRVNKDIEKFADQYLYNLSLNGQLLKNALKIIQSLAKTHQLVIMTNGMSSVQKPRFRASPLHPYFKHIIISEEIKHSKPSVKIYDHAFMLMNQPEKSKVLMIGDSLTSDIQGGINYAIDTTWYNPNNIKAKHSATYEINDLLQLIGDEAF